MKILSIRLKINLNEQIIQNNVNGTNNKDAIVYKTPSPCATATYGLLSWPIFNTTLINQGSPKDNKIAKELAPSEFAIPVPASPRRAIMTPVIISGVHPPIANTVKPNIDSAMPKVSPADNTKLVLSVQTSKK